MSGGTPSPQERGVLLMEEKRFSWLGWVTGGSAKDMASDAAKAAVVEALVPICVAQSEQDPERETRLAAIEETRPYQRRQVLTDYGWATMPGSSSANRDLAEACAEALVK